MTPDEYKERLAELESDYKKLEKTIYELKNAEIKEEKPLPPHPRWKPESGDAYFTTHCVEYAAECHWMCDMLDEDYYSLGFVFKTKAEAEFDAERLKVLAEMREWAGDGHYGAYIYYYRPRDEIKYDFSAYWYGEIRFNCVDDAINCVKAVGEDRIKKYYFMVPEDKSNV